MKICISISGQVRLENNDLLSLIEAIKNESSELVIVASVWDKVGKKDGGALGEPQLYRLFDEEVVPLIPRDKYWNLFNKNFNTNGLSSHPDITVDSFFKSIKKLDVELIEDVVSTETLDLSMGFQSYDSNSLRALYLSWRSGRLRKKIENDRGAFDLVIKIRPDLGIKSFDVKKLVAAPSKKCLLIPEYGVRKSFINDFYVVGDSESVTVYEAIFGVLLSKAEKWEGIHEELWSYLHESAEMQNIELYNAASYGLSMFIMPPKVYTLEDLEKWEPSNPIVNHLIRKISKNSVINDVEAELAFLSELNGNLNEIYKLNESSLFSSICYSAAIIYRKRGQHLLSLLFALLNILSIFDSLDVWNKRLNNVGYHVALQYYIAMRLAGLSSISEIQPRLKSMYTEYGFLADSISELITKRSYLVQDLIDENSTLKRHALKTIKKYEKNCN